MKYPLNSVLLAEFSLSTIQTLIIAGEIDIGQQVTGTYPSLSMLELTQRVPRGIVYMIAPNLRHLLLRSAYLFCRIYPPPDGDSQDANSEQKNKEVLEMLASSFPTVEVLEVHESLLNFILEMVVGEVFFTGLKELWTVSKDERKRVDLV